MTDETPEYLDLLKRAAKVRHFIAKHPGSTYSQIKDGVVGIKLPIKWLMDKGYIYRKYPQGLDNDFGQSCIYFPQPMGVPYEEPVFDEDLAVTSQAIRERDIDEV